MNESPEVPAQEQPKKSHPTMQNKPQFTYCLVYLTHNSDSLLVYVVIFYVAYSLANNLFPQHLL